MKKNLCSILLFCLCLGLLPSTAPAGLAISPQQPDRLILVGMLSTESGMEQVALYFKKDYVELTTNSNRVFGGHPSRLGLFRAPYSEDLKVKKRTAELILQRLRRTRATSHGTPREHALSVLLDEYTLHPGAVDLPELEEILGDAWKLGEWKPVDAVEISLSGKTPKVSWLGKSSKGAAPKATCRPGKKRSLCDVPGWGSAMVSLK